MRLIFQLSSIILHMVFVSCFQNDLGEVIFVSMLFRHGDRTPVDPYPNDPYKNNSLWPADWGELTNIGKIEHYELGKWLRLRYSNLLPKNYKKEDIYIRSTDVDRTLMSAYSNLAGLYEPDLKNNWNPDIKWTPIPVHTVPQKLDQVLAAEAPCEKYNIELNKLKNSPEFQKINKKNKKLYDYLTKYSGSNVTNVIDVERIYDSLFIENLYNFSLPNWTKMVFPQPMKEISEFTFSIPCYTPALARLKVGPLLGEILTHMSEKISDASKIKQKAWMYSAHDTTVANVLKALDLFQPHCPPYYSLILFELRKKGSNYFVANLRVQLDLVINALDSTVNKIHIEMAENSIRTATRSNCTHNPWIHYRNSTLSPPYFMQLKGCDKLCPFDDFKRIVSPLIPDDWEDECQAIRFAGTIYQTAASISFISLASLVLIVLFSVAIVVKFCKNQRWNQDEFAYKSLKLEVAS